MRATNWAGHQVRVTDDHAAGREARGETIAISTGGLGTSSTAVRHWRRGDEQLHHIVDPASGRPAPKCSRTVSVVAENGIDVNIASTATIVRGEAASNWLGELGLAVRLVRGVGEVVRIAGWPARVYR